MTSEIKDLAARTVSNAMPTLENLSRDLHSHPEIAWQELRAVEQICNVLDGSGFTITSNVAGLPTAFHARIGQGPLRIGLIAEYDALPGLGHACGHNLIAAIAAGAAGALAPLADDLGITAEVFGTPAEEGGGGKIEMLDRGAFEGLDLALMVHPAPVDVAEARPYAVTHSEIRFSGKAAHAAAYPEDGINAADAFTISQVAIGLLRQQLPESTRVHGIVTHAGVAPNAIPDLARGRWYVRAESLDQLSDIEERVRRCFEAGALATGCELEITPESKPYSEFKTDVDTLKLYVANAERIGRRFDAASRAARMNRASTDMGNVSQVVRSIHPYIGINSLPAVNHQPEFAAHAVSAFAHKAVCDAATALAWTAIDAAAAPTQPGAS